MRKLSLITFLLVLPTFAVTFFWLVSVGNFNWVDGMRCAPALIADMVVLLASGFISIILTDEDVADWTDGWKDHRAPSPEDEKAQRILDKYQA